MASLIDELIDVLGQEEKEYQDLILLSQEKTPVIVKGDLEKLQKITEAEQIVIGKINKLEKKRTEVAKPLIEGFAGGKPQPKGTKKVGNTIVRSEAKVGRNDPCPCGSGLKYKKCCGANKTDESED